jgi:hypothetical protein
VAGSNTLVLPATNGSAHQLLKNSGTAGTLEYGVTLPSGNGLAHQLVKNSSSAGTWEYGFTLPSGNGTADQALVTNGSGTLSFADRGRMVLETAQASTSGTEVDFTGIPSWVKRVTVMFSGVSTNGSSLVQVQAGAGSVTTSGYVSSVTSTTATPVNSGNITSGFVVIGQGSAGATISGQLVVTNVTGNVWCAGLAAMASGVVALCGGGNVTLSGTLDRLRITTVNGTDTFDAGSINLLLEG